MENMKVINAILRNGVRILTQELTSAINMLTKTLDDIQKDDRTTMSECDEESLHDNMNTFLTVLGNAEMLDKMFEFPTEYENIILSEEMKKKIEELEPKGDEKD